MRERKTIKVRFNNYLTKLIAINEKEFGNRRLTLDSIEKIRLNELRRAR